MKFKKILTSVAAVTMALAMTACTSGGSGSTGTTTGGTTATPAPAATGTPAPAESNPPEVSAEPDTITVMVPPVSGTYVEMLGGWIDEFKVLYPHIDVEVIATSWDEHTSKLTTMALAGEAPDIAEVSYGSVGTFVEMGTAINIADYMDPSRLADYDKNALDYMTLNDTLYGLPLYITIQALGGNREYLEAAGADVAKIQTQGWSYDEFLEIIANGTTDDTFGFVFANAGATTADFVSIFGVSSGISNSFTSDLKYAYTSDNMLDMLKAVEEMTSSGYMPNYSVEAAQRLVMLQTGQTMVTGKAMPLFESNIKKNILAMADGSAAEGSIELEYVFLPVPTMDGANESVYGAVDGFVALRNNNTTDEHLVNVMLFLDYICSGERAAAVDNELYLTAVCESGRQAQASHTLDQSDLNAAATARAITKVVAPPAGVSADLTAKAKTLMDETIVPKFQALLAGETTAEAMYDVVVKDAHALLGAENCVSGRIK